MSTIASAPPARTEPVRALFVCSQNRIRSPAAEVAFKGLPGVQVLSAGTDADAVRPIDAQHIEWATIILGMERPHQVEVANRFGELLQGRKLVCLGIEDVYDVLEPALLRVLKMRAVDFLLAGAASAGSQGFSKGV